MKKTITLILALTMLMSMAACGSGSSASSDNAIEPSVSESPEPAETPAVESEEPTAQPEETVSPDAELQPIESPEVTLSPEVTPVVTPLPSPDPNAPDIPAPTPMPPEISTESTDGSPALGILSNVWNTYPHDERFALAGGDYTNMTMDAPGSVNVGDTASLDALYGMPESAASYIDDAAGMMHMMNANTFTAGCYHLANSADMAAVAEALKNNIMNRQWMCGFPDTLIIVQVGSDSIVAAFGNVGLIENFKAKLSAAYSCTVLAEEALS